MSRHDPGCPGCTENRRMVLDDNRCARCGWPSLGLLRAAHGELYCRNEEQCTVHLRAAMTEWRLRTLVRGGKS